MQNWLAASLSCPVHLGPMRGLHLCSVATASVLLAFSPSRSAAQVLVLRGATVHTATGPAIPNATIVIRDGKIAAVGANVSVPAGATVVDLSGKEVIPGMIDNHSHIGAPSEDLNEFPASFAMQNRILDALNLEDPKWAEASHAGVTTVATGPGSGEVSSGEAVVIKTYGAGLAKRLLREQGGMKFAMGRKNPQRPPTTSPAVTSALRQQFIKAREYRDALARWEAGDKKSAAPPRDLGLEALVRVLDGKEDARVHVHTSHDIMAILRMKDEFGFDLTIHHATEAYKIPDEIAKRHVNVVGMPLFLRLGMKDEIMASGATLTRAGVTFAFHTDDPVSSSKWFRQTGGIGIRFGMTELDALKGLTINAAKIAHVADRVGSIEVGKDADLVVVNGPWYELTTRVDKVYVDGALAYERPADEKSVVVARAETPVTAPPSPSTAGRSSAPVIAIRNATVIPVSGPRIEHGTVLIRDGKILAVGPNVSVPAGATVVDATGKFVLPGIIDPMSYYGLEGADLNETPEPITPELDVLTAYTPTGVEFQGSAGSINAVELLSGGVTTQYVAPADATIIGGLGAIVKTASKTWDGLVVRRAAAVDMDLGAVPARTFRGRQRSPATQPAVVSTLRQALIRAHEYDQSWKAYNAKAEAERAKSAPPARNLGNDALVRLLHREIPARVQANTETDIRTAIRLAEEFGFDMILDGAAQGYKLKDELAAKKIRTVVAPLSYPFVTSEEIPDLKEYPAPDERNATWLHDAGVPVGLGSFSRTFGALGPPTAGRFLLLHGAMGAGYGMKEDDIIRMLTLDAAEILGVSDRVGSLTPGKDADVIILDGPPMSVKTWVERTYVNGELVYQRAK